MLAREWRGKLERVAVLEDGYAWNGKTYQEPVHNRQGDNRHKLERPSVLWLAIRQPTSDQNEGQARQGGAMTVAFFRNGAAR